MYAIEREVAALFDGVTTINDTCVQVRVGDVKAVSWADLDQALRKALATSKSPGMMAVVLDGKRVVVYEALVLSSRREDITRMAGDQGKPDTEEQATRRIGPDNELVHVRPEEDPFIGIRQAARRWIAVASYITRAVNEPPARHVFSIGTAGTPEDAARMRDLYVLGLWFDKQITKAPTLNYPPDQYQELFEPEWRDGNLTTHAHSR